MRAAVPQQRNEIRRSRQPLRPLSKARAPHCLLRLKDNPTQGTLEAFFGIDQSNVCRYLQFCNKTLGTILPTPRRISEAVSECKTVKELKEFIPGRGTRTLLVDGTHIPVRRSGRKDRRKEMYSGKKKRHTFNTTSVRYKQQHHPGNRQHRRWKDP